MHHDTAVDYVAAVEPDDRIRRNGKPECHGVRGCTQLPVVLRTALAQAYTAAGMTVPTYTYPTLTAGVSIVRAIDITELRNAVVAIE